MQARSAWMFPMLGAVLLSLCVGAWDVPFVAPPGALPDEVLMRTDTLAIAVNHFVGLYHGHLYTKPSNDTTAPWTLLPPTGLPLNSLGKNAVDEVVSVSADGQDLIAEGPDGRLHYMRFDEYKRGYWFWQGGFGAPIPGLRWRLHRPQWARFQAVSQRGADNGYYTDIDGTEHTSPTGCSTVYTVGQDGTTIYLVDGWILPVIDWFTISGPHRNRLVISGFSVSASTLFVTDSHGNMYTRLGDYDTLGYDQLLKYTYTRGQRGVDGPITLPPEDWVEQPAVPAALGAASVNITILQTGKGNSARELRVAGRSAGGEEGYFRKNIMAKEWSFVKAGVSVRDEDLVAAGPPVLVDSKDAPRMEGPSVRRFKVRFSVALEDWQWGCSPATLVFTLPPAGDAHSPLEIRLPLHHRPQYPKDAVAHLAHVTATESITAASDPRAVALGHYLFGSKPEEGRGFVLTRPGSDVVLHNIRLLARWSFRPQRPSKATLI